MGRPKKHDPNWGGAREGSGSKPMFETGALVPISAKVTAEQRDTFRRLGGAAWLRSALDAVRNSDGKVH